jgi:hypothetical protein
MEATSTTATVTATTTVLSERWIQRESETDESCKREEELTRTKWAHKSYLRSKPYTFDRGASGQGRRALLPT